MKYILLSLLLVGCHCNETCIKSHEAYMPAYTTFSLVGKIIIPTYHPAHFYQKCDEWKSNK